MWGPCYDGVKLESFWTRAYHLVYITRRFIFVSIGFFVMEPVFQFIGLMALNYTLIIYKASNRPFTTRFDNTLEILNEYLVNVCCIHLLFFTEEIPIET